MAGSTLPERVAQIYYTYEGPSQLDLLYNETQRLPYIWAKDKPLLYVQQIIMKVGKCLVIQLKMWDAFRAPLQEVFRLLETIRNHEDTETDGTARRVWKECCRSIAVSFSRQLTCGSKNMHKSKASLAEIAFGMQLRDTGIKRVAFILFRFVNSLTEKLKEMYPLYQDSPYSEVHDVTIIYYPGQFNYHELVPLTITFVGLFLYVYFSVRKIEFIKSKLGLAACAVLTIAGSLSMSMGICFFFGFSLSLQGKEIFPYLVIIVGLENVLVLTKSVTSTDSRLDVKIRLAQGLSKEGWSITKNLLIEITILTVSFFTFVPFIQEFSIFMIVSLISDYIIQMAFFATILGVEVRRMEYFQDQNKLHLKEYFHSNNALNWRFNKIGPDDTFSPQRMTKSKSHPRLNGLAHNSPTNVVAKRNSSPGHNDNRVPKRIRLVNIWARTRFFQRAFMVWMIVWISMIIYNSGVVDYFITNTEKTEKTEGNKKHDKNEIKPVYAFYNNSDKNTLLYPPMVDFAQSERSSSIAGRYAVVLPPVLISHRVSPELAAGVRNLDEKDPPPLSQEVECLVTDGEKVVSSCLQGSIKVWDSQNGEIITNIDRGAFFKLQKELYDKVNCKRNMQVPLIVAANAPATQRAQDLYCSETPDVYDYETKENVDITNMNYNSKDEEGIIQLSSKNHVNVNKRTDVRYMNGDVEMAGIEWSGKPVKESPVWCMDFCNDLIILGCADGRLEIHSNKMYATIAQKYSHCVWRNSELRSRDAMGLTHVRALSGGRRLCAASLSGHLTLLRLDAVNAASGARVDWRFSTAQRRSNYYILYLEIIT
ncbi:Uncharacterized protein OBRU01_05567 [Operophtera brumata]|uniref:Sterol regulatory element-binding protein cleavage-activating protein n=1 Tax=Operophtera brumata TaxID=104452 RepID=A0A0L7LN90_OPEBR|nr:Uncharacterized protein OBRU01_05567 [Operophtera brumata]